jgi:hypothetical protein
VNDSEEVWIVGDPSAADPDDVIVVVELVVTVIAWTDEMLAA